MTILQALLDAYGSPEQRERYKRQREEAEVAMAQVLREQTIIIGGKK